MIHSTLFPFDESSTWDPKHLKQILCIPEDQLNILNSLPEWSKVDCSSIHGVSKQSTILNSQSSQLDSQIPPTKPRENQHLSFKHIELFNKDQEYRRKILETCKAGVKKRHKSSSFVEIGKGNKVLLYSGFLKRTLSTPNILLQLGNLLPKQSSICSKGIVLNKTYTLSSILQNNHKEIFGNSVNKDSAKTLDNSQNLLENQRSEELFSNSSPNSEIMKVITQLPVNISCAEKNINDGVRIEVILEKDNALPTTHAASESIESDSHSLNAEKGTQEVESNASACNELESVSVIQPKVIENNASKDNLEINLNTQKVVGDSDNHTSCKVVDIFKEAVKTSENLPKEHALSKIFVHNASNNEISYNVVNIQETQKSCQDIGVSNISAEKPIVENLEINLNVQKMVMESNNQTSCKVDISREAVETFVNLAKEHALSKNKVHNVSNNEKCRDVLNIQATQRSHQDIGVANISAEKCIIAESAIVVKRKAESKKSSKKHKSSQEKKGYDPRSMKRAGEITYSIEEIKTMLDLVKHFL